jgi:hypothetical protein
VAPCDWASNSHSLVSSNMAPTTTAIIRCMERNDRTVYCQVLCCVQLVPAPGTTTLADTCKRCSQKHSPHVA